MSSINFKIFFRIEHQLHCFCPRDIAILIQFRDLDLSLPRRILIRSIRNRDRWIRGKGRLCPGCRGSDHSFITSHFSPRFDASDMFVAQSSGFRVQNLLKQATKDHTKRGERH